MTPVWIPRSSGHSSCFLPHTCAGYPTFCTRFYFRMPLPRLMRSHDALLLNVPSSTWVYDKCLCNHSKQGQRKERLLLLACRKTKRKSGRWVDFDLSGRGVFNYQPCYITHYTNRNTDPKFKLQEYMAKYL